VGLSTGLRRHPAEPEEREVRRAPADTDAHPEATLSNQGPDPEEGTSDMDPDDNHPDDPNNWPDERADSNRPAVIVTDGDYPILWRFIVAHDHGDGFDPINTFVAADDSTPARYECFSCGARFAITFESEPSDVLRMGTDRSDVHAEVDDGHPASGER